MAQDPDKPKDDGKIKLPKTDAGMNKLAPNLARDDAKGAKESKKEREKRMEEDAKILARMRKRFDRCIQAEGDNRKNGLEDLKFMNGEQWPADVAAQRNTDKRPCLTFNKLPTFVHQVTNDLRENRPSIQVSPVGEQTDVEASKIYGGLIRAIERDSRADIAYDTAGFNAVVNGFGYWRIITEYESEKSFNQVLKIDRVRNPFAVYMDPDATSPDGSDCRFGFVSEMIPRDLFDEDYPDANPVSWQASAIGDQFKEWAEKDRIRVVEYYESEHTMEDLVLLSNGFSGFKKNLSDQVKEQITNGHLEIMDERKSERAKTMWYKATYHEILDRTEAPFAGMIPIVRVIGEEIDVQGKVTYSGIIRNAKDPQRMYNYWRTTEAELVALQPKAPYVMEEGQMEGHEAEWKQANIKNNAVLTYKGTNVGGKPAPPPQRQPMIQPPAGVLQAIQGSAADMMAVTGIRFDATPNDHIYDESGRALKEMRRTSDIGSFHYQDNLSRSLHYTGKLLITAIPRVIDTKRAITIVREDGKDQRIMVDPAAASPVVKGQTPSGDPLPIFNPTIGRYGVTITTGPSYATKRIEAVDQMMSFVKALPNVAAIVPDLIAENMDWPKADQFAARLAKSIPPNMLAPDMKGVPAQVQAAMHQMQQQIQALMLEKTQMQKQLQDQTADRMLIADKSQKDFEAKILAVVQKFEQASDKSQMESSRYIDDKIDQALQLMAGLENPQKPEQIQ
jgi:hypothetical protein